MENEKNIGKIQESLMNNLERLVKAKDNISEEVARSNAVAQLANTYIKSMNLLIRVEESKVNVKNKMGAVANEKE